MDELLYADFSKVLRDGDSVDDVVERCLALIVDRCDVTGIAMFRLSHDDHLHFGRSFGDAYFLHPDLGDDVDLLATHPLSEVTRSRQGFLVGWDSFTRQYPQFARVRKPAPDIFVGPLIIDGSLLGAIAMTLRSAVPHGQLESVLGVMSLFVGSALRDKPSRVEQTGGSVVTPITRRTRRWGKRAS